MKTVKKIRLSETVIEESLFNVRIYGCSQEAMCALKDITFTPILDFSYSSRKDIVTRRIEVDFHNGCKAYFKLKGNAPFFKKFSTEDFIKNFYAIKDNKAMKYSPYEICFKYYNKK